MEDHHLHPSSRGRYKLTNNAPAGLFLLAFVAQLSAPLPGAQEFEVVIEPQQIVFNLDEGTPTAKLSVLVTGPPFGPPLVFSIDVPQRKIKGQA